MLLINADVVIRMLLNNEQGVEVCDPSTSSGYFDVAQYLPRIAQLKGEP